MLTYCLEPKRRRGLDRSTVVRTLRPELDMAELLAASPDVRTLIDAARADVTAAAGSPPAAAMFDPEFRLVFLGTGAAVPSVRRNGEVATLWFVACRRSVPCGCFTGRWRWCWFYCVQ